MPDPKLQNAPDKFEPYLFIGLGGSGKQVLVQLRRLLIEKYGTCSLPHIRFLCIDTDLAGVRVDIKDDNPYYKRANFSATNEIVDAAITQAKLTEIYRNRAANAHIFSWFDPILENLGVPTHGAAQVRSFGRLAFFQHYDAISSKINNHIDALNGINRQAFENEYGAPLGQEAQVWVVHSVAGGTGSGMFLDCAFLVRHLAESRGIAPKVRAVSLLPDLWTTDITDRRYANSYSALKELDFFNYSRLVAGNEPQGGGTRAGDDRFRLCWTPELYAQSIYKHPPVFDTTFLVGADSLTRQTGAEYLTGERRIHLTQSLADWMFQLCAADGRVPEMLNSNLSNQLTRMVLGADITTRVHGRGELAVPVRQHVSRAYGSVGFSKLFYPTERQSEYARYRLAAVLVKRWRDGKEPPGAGLAIGRHQAELFIEPYGGSAGTEIGKQLRDKLGLNDQNEETKVGLATEFGRLRQILEADPTPDGTMALLQEYNRFGQNLLADEGIDANKGAHWRDANQVRLPKLKERLIETLNAIIASYYRTPGARSVHALNTLNEIKNRFVEVAASQKEYEEGASDAVKYYRDRFDLLTSFLDGKINSTSRTVARVAVGELQKSAIERLTRIHHAAAASLALDMERIVGELITEVRDLDLRIAKLEDRLSNAESELSARIDPCHYARVELVASKSAEQAYRDRNNVEISPQLEAKLENDWYVGERAEGAWGLRAQIPDGADKIALGFAKDNLISLKANSFDVLKLLRERDGVEAVKAKANIAALNASVRIGQAQTNNGYAIEGPDAAPTNYTFIIRAAAADEVGKQAYNEAVMAHFPEAEVSTIDGPSDAVSILRYKVAIPLALVGGIEGWRGAYDAYLAMPEDKPARVVHVFRAIDTFNEFLALDQFAMENRLVAIRVALDAIIAGIIKPSWGSEERSFLNWDYSGGPPFFDDVKVGRLQSLVQRIQAQDTARDENITYLIRLVNQERATWPGDIDKVQRLSLLCELLRRAHRHNTDRPKQLAGLVANGVPGWREALEVLHTELRRLIDAAGLSEDPTVFGNLLATKHDWAVEAAEGSGFFQMRR